MNASHENLKNYSFLYSQLEIMMFHYKEAIQV